MAKRKKWAVSNRKKKGKRGHARRNRRTSRSNIKKLLVLAGLGFGLYMVMKGQTAPAVLPPVATVDGRQIPMSIVSNADLQKMMNA